MNKRNKKILALTISLSTILLSGIVGVSYALATRVFVSSIHLQIKKNVTPTPTPDPTPTPTPDPDPKPDPTPDPKPGNIAATLVRTYQEKYYLKDGTEWKTESSSTTKDFSDGSSNNDNIFGGTDKELWVPKTYYVASLKLTNTGDVTFNFNVKITVDSSSDDALLSSLEVYSNNSSAHQFTYDEKKTLSKSSDNQILTGSLAKDESQAFSVKVLLPESATNYVMDKKVNFDLIVEVYQ